MQASFVSFSHVLFVLFFFLLTAFPRFYCRPIIPRPFRRGSGGARSRGQMLQPGWKRGQVLRHCSKGGPGGAVVAKILRQAPTVGVHITSAHPGNSAGPKASPSYDYIGNEGLMAQNDKRQIVSAELLGSRSCFYFCGPPIQQHQQQPRNGGRWMPQCVNSFPVPDLLFFFSACRSANHCSARHVDFFLRHPQFYFSCCWVAPWLASLSRVFLTRGGKMMGPRAFGLWGGTTWDRWPLISNKLNLSSLLPPCAARLAPPPLTRSHLSKVMYATCTAVSRALTKGLYGFMGNANGGQSCQAFCWPMMRCSATLWSRWKFAKQ